MAKTPQGKRYGRYQVFTAETAEPNADRAAEYIIDTIEGIDPRYLRDEKALNKTLRAAYAHVGKNLKDRKQEPIGLGHLKPAHRHAINAAILEKTEEVRRKVVDDKKRKKEFEEELKARRINPVGRQAMIEKQDFVEVDPTEFGGALMRAGGLKVNGKAPVGKMVASPAERLNLAKHHAEKADAAAEGKVQSAMDMAKAAIDAQTDITKAAISSGGNTPVHGTGVHIPPKSDAKALKRAQREVIESWGLSRTTADKLLNRGFDPAKPPKTMDAETYGLKGPTITALTAQGIHIKNKPGQKSSKVGLTTGELLRGKASSASSAVTSARQEKKRRIFKKKVDYVRGANGQVERVELDAKVTGDTLGKGLKKLTVGAVAKGIKKSQAKRDKKKLDSPFHRINAIDRVETDRRLTQLEGEYRHGTGFARQWALLKMQVLKVGLIHKGWMALLLVAAILFVPWFGVLTWTGWGLGALALTVVKFGASVLVGTYNLLASFFLGAISVVGNVVVGFLEWIAMGALDLYGLNERACDTVNGETQCNRRIFAYTQPSVDTSFPGWPAFPKPKGFDDRTLIQIVLDFFGIKFGVFNEISHWFRGGR